MSRKKLGGILIAAVLCIVVLISFGMAAYGEELLNEPDGDMHISEDMLAVLKKLEGFSPYAYWDYQQWSIGYGSRCPEGMQNYYSEATGNQITEEYAEELLLGELVGFENTVNAFIKRHDLTLQQHQYDALISFTYNTGYHWNSTTGNLVTAVMSGDTGTHITYGLMLWSSAGGRNILISRRIVEANIYCNGVYPEDPYAESAIPEHYRVAFMDANGGVVNYDEHGFDAESPVPIKTKIKSSPTGPDETGAIVTYEFDGWYTQREGGTKVEQLDTSIPHGTMLYAHWKTPSGTPVVIPRKETGMKVTVTVTGTNVNVRYGPETYYASLYRAQPGDVLEIVETASRGSLLWGRFGDTWISLKHTDYNQVIEKMLPMWGKVTGTTLNVRTGAGTDYDTVPDAQKKEGDLVLVTEWKSDGSIMWGKIDEGWVALSYVTFDGVLPPDQTVVSIEVIQKPAKLTYVHKAESLDLTDGKLLVTYADNSTSTVDMTGEMATGFDNATLGTNTVTLTYQEKTTTFDVEIVKAKVVFQMDDGTPISEKEYLFADAVEIPANPTKPNDGAGNYFVFAGWGREVAQSCDGSAVYVAQFQKKALTGDSSGDSALNDQDAFYLLRHVYFPDRYSVAEPADYNGDGTVNDQDAFYLLRHIYFPDRYPLK